MAINLRMFDVGLGAAILLQFGEGAEAISVLADGGDARAGPDVEAFLAKNLPITRYQGKPRLDLLIGTHYDADHLDGLTTILTQGRVEIGELWLPPVLDDTDAREAGRVPQASTALATLFSGPAGTEAFSRYVEAKNARLDMIDTLENAIERDDEDASARETHLGERHSDYWSPQEAKGRFSQSLTRAGTVLGNDGCEHDHGADRYARLGLLDFSYWGFDLFNPGKDLGRLREAVFEEEKRWPDYSPSPVRLALAHMRRATATDGINACSLRSLLMALPTDNSIRVRHLWCADDEPCTIGWNIANKRFSIGGTAYPRITLLGPTERLVGDRRDKLPRAALAFTPKRWDRLEGLSDSNQLSYVLRFDHEQQGVLITGDSGFDGFAIGSDRVNRYETRLTDHLRDLNVIQVPHHGGINRHFYRAMDAAGFRQEEGSARLLLSHEAGSTHRPNGAFASYMNLLRSEREVRLLFTGRPADENVEDYLDWIEGPVQPRGCSGRDVVLNYSGGNWSVVQHADQK